MNENKAEFAVVQILNGNATLATELDGRITPLLRDENGTLPAIVYAGSAPNRQRYLDGSFMDIATVDMSFELWATNYIQAKRLVSIAVGALNNFSGNIAGISVLTIDCEAGPEGGIWDGDEMVVEFTAKVTAKGL
ncbi:hypothetical protein JAO78_005175 [Alishewanella sp. 16-MA]|uniref:DUF3168 domain-containing protein n=1 Tax=Alishewanella maricola TaxID=2795740 RepID=A0ABS8C1J4_9ALTE|nr:hypothetical protein [Alishewanella maricola]MCB5226203.1 hypothetical protein [Alishewanella maricola]